LLYSASRNKHVEDVRRRVAIKHGNGHEVQIEKLALQTDAHAQVEERLATVSAAIARQRKGQDHVVVEHVDNHLQIGGDKDADVLSDDQIIDA
jgi:predicted RNA-binding protein with TRAM domain